MARFLETSNIIINTDYIAVVQKVSKDHLIVTMKDGEVVHLPGYLVSRISGADAIRQVVPVQNVFAVCNNDGKEERYPVPLVAVTEDGEVRALDLCAGFMTEFFDTLSNYRGLVVDGDFIPAEQEADHE